MTPEDFNRLECCLSTLTKSLNTHCLLVADSRCDKQALGFNLDDRFSSLKMNLSLCSWRGYYGDSGCSNYFFIGSEEIFKRYLLKVLNNNVVTLLTQVKDEVEKDLRKHKEAKIKALELELENLKKL